MKSRRSSLLLCLGLILTLSACGFHLQGRVPMPASLASVYLDAADAQSDFVRALRRSLQSSGVTLAATKDVTGVAVLHIERDELLERVASVSARNVPREYELTYLVRYSVELAGTQRQPAEEVSTSRDFSFDERIALAKEHERDALKQSLADELARIVLQRLASLR